MTQTFVKPNFAEIAQAFHGELCPGLAMGVQAAKLAVDRLGRDGLVAVAESDICAIDAIQAITGCTLGNRNLIHLDYPAWDKEYQDLRARVNAGIASEADKAALPERTAAEAFRILEAAPEELFGVTELREPIPVTSTVDPWLTCESCGEPVMETRARRLRGQEYCVPCFNQLRAQAS